MPLAKKYSKDQSACEVTFQLPSRMEARSAYVAGEFNGWDKDATPMTQVDGVWQVTLKLQAGREYQYRYLVNGSTWENDDSTDKYIAHPYGGENSVVVV